MSYRRSSPGGAWPGLFSLLFAVVSVHAVQAQDPVRPRPRPDSIARDTARTIADTLQSPRVLVKHLGGMAPGFGTAVWVWERDDLLREGALTLSDLLQQLPSTVSLRSGLVLQPEVSSAFAQTRGRIQILLDGYELDPLLEATHDFARIELVNLQRVRIERRLEVTRIELASLEPTDGRPHSRIEAGVGEPDTNLFRGLFLASKFLIGPLGFGIERIDSDGLRRREPAENFAGWAKWGWVRDHVGIQAEIRRSTLEREPNSPWVGTDTRRDLILRARFRPVRQFVGEAFVGHSEFEHDTTTAERVQPDSAEISLPNADVLQFGLASSFDTPLLWGRAEARFRSNQALPARQLDVEGGVRLGAALSVAGNLAHADWAGRSVLSYGIRGVTGTFAGLHAFAEIAAGDRAGPSARFLTSDSVFVNSREGFRLGAGFARWGGFVSAALVSLNSDSLQSFGLPFDSTNARFRGGDVKGWEVEWRAPLLLRGLAALGSFTNWPSGSVPVYLPNQSWRVALQFHDLPLRSGNLELLGRIEMRRRGEMVVPQRTISGTRVSWNETVLPAFDQIDGYMQIRVIDVRIFLRAENLANKPALELPGREITGPRIMYGVKWVFWN